MFFARTCRVEKYQNERFHGCDRSSTGCTRRSAGSRAWLRYTSRPTSSSSAWYLRAMCEQPSLVLSWCWLVWSQSQRARELLPRRLRHCHAQRRARLARLARTARAAWFPAGNARKRLCLQILANSHSARFLAVGCPWPPSPQKPEESLLLWVQYPCQSQRLCLEVFCP